MADKKDYTSLLNRSSGASWGDIAGAYLSGSRKKDNRARNVMLATLFFNAKEANMQNKVMKNLKELEDSKAIELAKLNKQWETREKLQTEYEGVKDKGAYGYYKTDAETAFEETFGTDPKLIREITAAVKSACMDKPLMVKLTPTVTDISVTADTHLLV